MQSLIVVKFSNPAASDEVFHNAEVAVAPPGLFVIQNDRGQLGMFPIGEVRAILFPEGPSRITEVTL